VYKLYVIQNKITDDVYFGMTKNHLSRRLSGHRSVCKNKNTKLCNAVKKYGFENFSTTILKFFSTKAECCQAEIDIIKFYREKGINTYNLSEGGDGGYNVPIYKKEDWIVKLKLARQERTPAKGMKHTEESKKFFSKVSRQYWDSVYTYPKSIVNLPFKLAREKYGISRTHFYRLKRIENNDLN
jgi:group I intron endonuclease